MVKCPHAASGCNYPEGDCPGHCLVDNGLRKRQDPPAYLTIVYRITHPGQPRALLEQAEWSAASHTHAIHERDQLHAEINDVQDQRRAAFRTIERLNDELAEVCEQRDELLKALSMARECVEFDMNSLIETCSYPDGRIESADLALIASYAEKLGMIDAAIAKSGSAA